MEIPHQPTDEAALKSYNLRVTLNTGVHNLIRFLKGIEEGNPYITLSNLSIGARKEDPANHAISFEIQWPVWAEPTMGETLETRLKEALESSLTTPRRR